MKRSVIVVFDNKSTRLKETFFVCGVKTVLFINIQNNSYDIDLFYWLPVYEQSKQKIDQHFEMVNESFI